MANLIEQMNVLKGLDDASLQGEIQSPSGSAPPFLVLTEINRRKDMRQRYDSNKARQKPSTTVVEDMTFGLPAMPASTQGMPGGIGEAMGAPMPPVQGFSMGGLVDAVPGYAEGGVVDYSDMARRYNDRLAGLSGDRDRARAMALLAASGAILGGGSSNTLKNVGGGISAFAGSYGDQLRGIDSQELELLRGISNVGQAQSQMDMAALDQDFRERQLASQERQAAARLNTERKPVDILKFEAFQQMTREEQEEYLRLNPPYNPNAVTASERLSDDLDKLYADAQKIFPINSYDTPVQAAEKQRQAQALAYQKISASRGKPVADAWAADLGVAVGDLVMGEAAGAGGASAVGFEEYFGD